MATRKSTKTRRTRTATARKPETLSAALLGYWDAGTRAVTTVRKDARRQAELVLENGRQLQDDAADAVKSVGKRAQKEQARLIREWEARVREIEARIAREKGALGKRADSVVKSALATLNVPSREEVMRLTRKIDVLSRRIDTFRSPARA